MRLLCAYLAALSLLIFATQAAAADDGQIAFERSGDIWIMGGDGTGLTNLTSSSALEYAPGISPDGQWVAYTDSTNRALYKVRLSDKSAFLVHSSPYPFITDTTWSPDGQYIVFRQGPYNYYDLWRVGADGTGAVNLTSNGKHNGHPCYSPDGTKIVYSSRSIPPFAYSVEVWKMNADGTGKTQLTFGGNSGWTDENDQPDWSPDGSKILYRSGANGKGITSSWKHDIWIMNPDGTGQTSVTYYPAGFDVFPRWSPNGWRLAFLRGGNVWLGNPDGTGLTQLTFTGGIGSQDWGPSAVLEVSIDAKPGSDPNAINPKSKGVIPVAILTTSKADGDSLDFDATDVDPDTVAFGPDGASKAHTHAHLEDVDGDGDTDLLLHFRTQETGIAAGDTGVSLTGTTYAGRDIIGTDSIKTVGGKK